MNYRNCCAMRLVVVVFLAGTGLVFSQTTANVNFATTKQVIDGFGAATVWHGALSDALMDVAFKNENNNQLGLTILRESVEPGGTSSWGGAKSNIQKARARGAMVFATPWSPPASMKDNNSTVDGHLKTSSYADYAAYLKSFGDYVGSSNIDFISVQNEPNIDVSYTSCFWDATQLLNFCKNNAKAIGYPVMMPEAFNFDTKLSDPTLDDPVAAANVSYIGGHLYGSRPFEYTKAINLKKKIWMTEKYFDPDDASNCMQMAKEILDCMYYSMNAYVWWYYRTTNCNLINSDGSIKKKGYVMAQFSKFVRHGYYRVEATYNPQSGIYIVAFKGDNNVVVAINNSTSSKTQTFTYSGVTVTSVKKVTSSSSKNLAADNSVAVANNSFTTTLDAQSVNTFVSEGTPINVVPYSIHNEQNTAQLSKIASSVYLVNGQKWQGSVVTGVDRATAGMYVLRYNQVKSGNSASQLKVDLDK